MPLMGREFEPFFTRDARIALALVEPLTEETGRAGERAGLGEAVRCADAAAAACCFFSAAAAAVAAFFAAVAASSAAAAFAFRSATRARSALISSSVSELSMSESMSMPPVVNAFFFLSMIVFCFAGSPAEAAAPSADFRPAAEELLEREGEAATEGTGVG